MPIRAPRYSIILAAGKGTRMQSTSIPKVCFPVDGKPAIVRAIENYNGCGVRQHLVVVGALAGQVIETVGCAFHNATFAYQAEQLGTAHAARVGLRALRDCGDDEDVLLVVGDRIIEPSVLEQLFDIYYSRQADLALLATSRAPESGQGRIVQDPAGRPVAIIERADVRQRRVLRELRHKAAKGQLPANSVELLEWLRSEFSPADETISEKKLTAAFGPLWEALRRGERVLSGQILAMFEEERTWFEYPGADGTPLHLTPEEVEATPLGNASVYLTKLSALTYGLERLTRDNAQGEEYLSDLVGILNRARINGVPAFRMELLRVTNPHYVLGFNNPAELLEVSEIVRSRSQAIAEPPKGEWLKEIRDWRERFEAVSKLGETGDPELWRRLVAYYSDDVDGLRERIEVYRELLAHAAQILGEEQQVLIVRSPGRVNVMGRHVDHQGGNCNLMTISFETLMAVHPREDDRIRLINIDRERFGEREFSIGELVQDLPWDDWLSLVNSEKVTEMARAYGGDWSQYIKAAILRLQKKFMNRRLRGMDLIVGGNIPMAAGLSSSSSLVVGAAEASIAVSRLETFPTQFVDLCGEGEWFVGTRGGAADHAAVKMGQQGKVVKVTFFDFAIQETVAFPEAYRMVVCDSGISAKKNTTARNQFNHRISCYRIGLMLIRRLFPQYAPLLRHLRDVNMRTLGLPLGGIYRMLLYLPERIRREELKGMLEPDQLDPLFVTHEEPPDGVYPVRGVVLFGLAEFERARLYAEFLKRGELEQIGRMMRISHDGDRVARMGADGGMDPYVSPVGNGYLLDLIEDLESGDPERVNAAQLQWQPGGYSCSLTEIDQMVDLAVRTPGVLGAQLAGAGLGGCMMVLARREAVEDLRRQLTQNYYAPAARRPVILVCRPIAGSGVLLMDAVD